MHAVRNIIMCSKDCLCLFICPTGATDTENGQIDAGKCLDGCRLCVDACPSKAIYLVHGNYPERETVDPTITAALCGLAAGKSTNQLMTALAAAQEIDGGFRKKLLLALSRSNRILSEDCIRETGCMIPDNRDSREALTPETIIEQYQASFAGGNSPADAGPVREILEALITSAETDMDAPPIKIGICDSCGMIFTGEIPENCSHCGGDSLSTM